jgi:hypothetical protein
MPRAHEYSSIGVSDETREQLKKLRDGFGYDNYETLIRSELIGDTED